MLEVSAVPSKTKLKTKFKIIVFAYIVRLVWLN